MKFILFLAFILPQLLFAAPVKTEYVEAELVPYTNTIPSEGKFTVGLRLKMKKGWHTYWQNPGDSGLSTKIDWKLPVGVTAEEIQWPYPHRLDVGPLTNFGYEGEVLLPINLNIAKNVKIANSLALQAKVYWLVCEKVCIPGEANLKLELKIDNNNSQNLHPKWRYLFQQAKLHLPQAVPSIKAIAQQQDRNIQLQITGIPKNIKVSHLDFFPHHDSQLEHPFRPRHQWQNETLVVDLLAAENSETKKTLKGVLVMRDRGQALAVEINALIEVTNKLTKIQKPSWNLSILFFAFLGGLILNLMPCVFPVLAIKVLGLIETAAQNRKLILFHSFFYTLGVLFTFSLLATSLWLLKSAGHALGWGFQLQSPEFILFLIFVFFALGLNQIGLFSLGNSVMNWTGRFISQKKHFNAFFTGIIAVLIATPCTAPFMGTAMGVAIIQPFPIMLLIFNALALGLAAPYVLFCSFPQLLSFLPKPGLWMDRLKKILAIPLFLTCLWLGWVLYQQVVPQKLEMPAHASLQWEKFSREKVKQLRAQNELVFVNFTASWCITCQVNDRVVFSNSEVLEKVKEYKLRLLVADWTNEDPEITKSLAEFNRVGVPLYLIYKGQSKAKVLPQILTPSIFLEALESSHKGEH